jgi:hypothetical protein
MNKNMAAKRFLMTLSLLLGAALIIAMQSTSTQAQSTTPTLEELAARVEILRAQQQSMAADSNDFKMKVASATVSLNADVAAAASIAVPVGGVVSWWGEQGSIPENFELCDGNAPTTPGALLTGNKPNLISRFIRGANSAVGATGGLDTVASTTTDPHTLTLDQIPSHNHVPDESNPPVDSDYKWLLQVSGEKTPEGNNTLMTTPTEPTILRSKAIASEGGDQPHSHGMPGHDNRPAFCELFYIIRVK